MIKTKLFSKMPPQNGFTENSGTAGNLYGVINNRIIIGGGANFPYKSLVEGGEKVVHKDIFLMNDKLELLDQIQLDEPIAYGSSTTDEKNLYYIGNRNIKRIYIENDKLKYENIFELDFNFENGISEYFNGDIYFGINSSKEFFKYNIEKKEITKLKYFPGNKRAQAVSSILDNKVVVFGGGAESAYFDGYYYDIDKRDWFKLKDIIISGEELSILGAGCAKINENEMLVIGGFNKDVLKEATYNLTHLEGDAKASYRIKYLSMNPIDYMWNKKALVYNIVKNSWKSIGKIDFDAPCGNSLLKLNDKYYSFMGEIKPGVRTANIYEIEL